LHKILIEYGFCTVLRDQGVLPEELVQLKEMQVSSLLPAEVEA
jgi:hypothetical protein